MAQVNGSVAFFQTSCSKIADQFPSIKKSHNNLQKIAMAFSIYFIKINLTPVTTILLCVNLRK